MENATAINDGDSENDFIQGEIKKLIYLEILTHTKRIVNA